MGRGIRRMKQERLQKEARREMLERVDWSQYSWLGESGGQTGAVDTSQMAVQRGAKKVRADWEAGGRGAKREMVDSVRSSAGRALANMVEKTVEGLREQQSCMTAVLGGARIRHAVEKGAEQGCRP